MVKVEKVLNYLGGEWVEARSQQFFDKFNPATGEKLVQVARSNLADVEIAISQSKEAQKSWARTPAVRRGEILFDIVKRMEAKKEDIARVVALETGKSYKDALGETGAAISQGYFMAGEGARLYGRTTGSSVDHRMASIVREPVGITALIVAFNTPIANVAWKVFPSLICGNAVLLKGSEDTPLTANIFAQIVHESQLPKGVFHVLYGLGNEVGSSLVSHKDIGLVSFTGSTEVGRIIAQGAGQRLAKVFLELGGKNPMVVCEDADLENACKWALLSSFSNAGQRCAASSRILVFDSIYDKFKKMFVEKAQKLKVGCSDQDDLGPVINSRQIERMEKALTDASSRGVQILVGGKRLDRPGYFMAPTIYENASWDDPMTCHELFGPITGLYRVKSFEEAVEKANATEFGLTSAIHTRDYNKAMEFSRLIQAGVCSINAGTHGSEPHMPFGGVKSSGTGGREPGPEALDVYTQLKVVYHNVNPTLV